MEVGVGVEQAERSGAVALARGDADAVVFAISLELLMRFHQRQARSRPPLRLCQARR